jgi:hypothetical protein
MPLIYRVMTRDGDTETLLPNATALEKPLPSHSGKPAKDAVDALVLMERDMAAHLVSSLLSGIR